MHELSIAKSVIAIVEKSLPFDFSGKVSSVTLQIGSLSGIETDALSFSFGILKEKSRLPEAELLMDHVQALAECRQCHHVFEIKSFGEPCPECNSFLNTIIKGKEMKVLRITVEEAS